MSKLKEVLERRLAAVGEKLEALTKEEPAEVKALKQQLAALERIYELLKTSTVANLVEADQRLCDELGVKKQFDCRNIYEATGEKLKELTANDTRHDEMDRLQAEQKKFKELLPYIDMIEGALADYLPLVKEVAAEIEPHLVEVITLVCGDLLAKTYLDVQERAQRQYAERAATLWAGGLKTKREALLAAGFSKPEALQILLASLGNSMMGNVMDMMKVGADLRKRSGARR